MLADRAEDAEPVAGGVLDQNRYEFSGRVRPVPVVCFPDHPRHQHRRDLRKPERKTLCQMHDSHLLGVRRHPESLLVVAHRVNDASGGSCVARDHPATPRGARLPEVAAHRPARHRSRRPTGARRRATSMPNIRQQRCTLYGWVSAVVAHPIPSQALVRMTARRGAQVCRDAR